MYITFILQNNSEQTVKFTDNQTILSVAEENGIPLHGACEGFGICGKCHVLIENFHEKLPTISEIEEDGLDKSKCLTMHSRLACQIKLNKGLDGLRIKLL